jgi:hypothetical protein
MYVHILCVYCVCVLCVHRCTGGARGAIKKKCLFVCLCVCVGVRAAHFAQHTSRSLLTLIGLIGYTHYRCTGGAHGAYGQAVVWRLRIGPAKFRSRGEGGVVMRVFLSVCVCVCV